MFPDQASTQAANVDTLFVVLLILASFFTLLIAGLIVWFAIKYRRRSDDELPVQISGSTTLEVLWTIIPLTLALGVFFWGANLYLQAAQPPENAEEIFILGRQWLWKIQHANGQQEISELHVPVGRPIKLIMTSQDVIHSFFVPAFRIKQDVVPGRYTTTWFEATKVGEYTMFCAEYCGTQHSGMLARVVVMEPTAYQVWLGGGPLEGPAAPGARLFQQLGCIACHRADGSGAGPSLIGLFGKRVQLQSGDTVTADENYLRESIVNPPAKIVAGYQPIMPTFQDRVDEEQLMQLIIYLKSLGTNPPGAAPAARPTP